MAENTAIERPILFSPPMVRALLAGTKTQTRRVMVRQKQHAFTDYTLFGQRGHPDDEAERRGGWAEPWVAVEHAPDWPDGKEDQCRCPYASHRGDRLWVRHQADLFPVYFKPIVGWDGLYAAGTNGRIYRMERDEPQAHSGSPTSKGYLTVSLSRGAWETHAVHKLVCETFYGRAPLDGAQVRHMDGNQENNRPENLDWGTQADNWQDRKAHGRGMGQQHHAAKLTPAMVEAIRASTLSQRTLASEYGVSQATIWEAKNGKTWGEHLVGERNLPAFKMWKSPIHMPRWASRILLEVTEIRAQRLQDISEEDAKAEGVTQQIDGWWSAGECQSGNTARAGYRLLWNAIHGPGSWDANPWVWAVSFLRLKP